MNIFIAIVLLVVVIVKIIYMLQPRLQKLRNIFIKQPRNIFESFYIDPKGFYLYRFKKIPSMTLIDDIDVTKAFQYINETYDSKIVEIYQACNYNHEKEKQEFDITYFVLSNKMLVQLGNDYARVLFANNNYDLAGTIVTVLSKYKLPEKKEDFEINIITLSANGLELKSLEIKPTDLNTDLYYNDDFKEVDEIIRNRMNQQNDRGILLLHGLPGTGKTTYLRYLIGMLKKKVLFVSPSVAGNLMNPEFIDLLIDNPNAVVIIEDAENIMMDRKFNSNSSVSNLLNLSDGLLSDCLSVQIICTFNSSVQLIDEALMRKGRLIARYEFGKLEMVKAQKLSNHFGYDTKIEAPMTLAEIANQNDKQPEVKKFEVVGFKRSEVVMN